MEKKRALPSQQSSRTGRTLFPRPNLYQVEWSCSSFFLTGTYWLLPSHSKKKKRQRKKKTDNIWALHRTVWGVRFSRRVKGTCCYCTLDQGSVRLRSLCVLLPDATSRHSVFLWKLPLCVKHQDIKLLQIHFATTTTTITGLRYLCFPIVGSQPWGLNIMCATWDALQHTGAWHELFELNNRLSSLPRSSVRLDICFLFFVFFRISSLTAIAYCCDEE